LENKFLIEIATSDFITTKMAVQGGADRIELCANLAEGGVTPSLGTLRQCRAAFESAIYAMIRPRGGDFLYTKDEFDIMLRDVLFCKEIGCDGIVVGLLRADGNIDIERTARLVDAAYPLGVTFHRAFDRCLDPMLALEQLIDIGCERILTSGQKPTAEEGLELITRLQVAAAHRLIIMPGSGIRKDNIRAIATKTGCLEFHASLRGRTKSSMEFIHPAFANSEESYFNNGIDPNAVQQMRAALSSSLS
jgi:copper homeostasis protein